MTDDITIVSLTVAATLVFAVLFVHVTIRFDEEITTALEWIDDHVFDPILRLFGVDR